MRTGLKLFVILAVIAALALGYMLIAENDGKNTVTVDLYFLNETSTEITLEQRDIKFNEAEDLPQKVMNELKKGPKTDKLKAFLPKGTKWTIEKRSSGLLVDFSKEYLTKDENYNLLSSYAVVKSLCSLPDIYAVKLTVEGADVILPDNTTIGYISNGEINTENDVASSKAQNMALYFVTPEGKLKAEWRNVTLPETTKIVDSALTELVKGPETDGLMPSLASDTDIISVEIIDMIAYVNIPDTFIVKNSGDALKEKLAVYSIVNSLCEIDGIANVQFLVNGKKESGFSSVDLSELLSVDYSIVEIDKK